MGAQFIFIIIIVIPKAHAYDGNLLKDGKVAAVAAAAIVVAPLTNIKKNIWSE